MKHLRKFNEGSLDDEFDGEEVQKNEWQEMIEDAGIDYDPHEMRYRVSLKKTFFFFRREETLNMFKSYLDNESIDYDSINPELVNDNWIGGISINKEY